MLGRKRKKKRRETLQLCTQLKYFSFVKERKSLSSSSSQKCTTESLPLLNVTLPAQRYKDCTLEGVFFLLSSPLLSWQEDIYCLCLALITQCRWNGILRTSNCCVCSVPLSLEARGDTLLPLAGTQVVSLEDWESKYGAREPGLNLSFVPQQGCYLGQIM